MRKLIAAVSVLALALVLAPAALAAGPCDGTGPGGGAGGGSGAQTQTHARLAKYSLGGVVKAVDSDASTLSVLVKQANRRARAYKGEVVAITVTATTRLYQRTVDGELVSITLADFEVGDRITSVGKLAKTDPAAPVFTATRVTLRLPLGTCVN